jgi:hypothetical protein
LQILDNGVVNCDFEDYVKVNAGGVLEFISGKINNN